MNSIIFTAGDYDVAKRGVIFNVYDTTSRVGMFHDEGRAIALAKRLDQTALAAACIEKIGYDPFADDPTINPETVRKTLAEYDAVARAGE